MTIGTSENPLRVAIIGSGPSGFYAAEALFKSDLTVEVDMYDRLPTPYGLVRGGVAPDHQKIKSVTKVYDKIAENPNFRFYGNVDIGNDLSHDDLLNHYHQIIYAVGAQTDRRLDIPGEDLSGSHAATEFVAWYNGHPDYRELEFDLSQEAAIVVGVGNVAMDVARILARSHAELMETDIADYALEALNKSNIKKIYILGRRGPAQAAFTNPEIKELGEMEDAEIIVDPSEVALDELSQEYLANANDRAATRNVEIMTKYSEREPNTSKPKQIILRFLASPVEVIGTDRVEAVKIVKNELYKDNRGGLRPRATDQFETISAGLIFRSVGYRGVALAGVPFREDWGTIPNEMGRIIVLETKETVLGEYAVGWIKRGPSGIIGTNKPDSVETVQAMLEDAKAGKVLSPTSSKAEDVEGLLKSRNIQYVTYADWHILDQLERERGAEVGRMRLKFTRIEDMLTALAERKQKITH
ncbi:MAG: FAD-dependent oxidoreductase [Anaerolineales bacterium]|nr:FAD-dependent oxidoreductase [Anaerolineales bacterium]